ncbi:hypothetical protein Shyhy01_57790 [Streptomyces hygroscopicus subsp. hygroscopicus]|uniref:hypothetical protein n=1 Tax=Streptomyces sp. KHY 26 TaxID=3097359 RepID=UPI00249FC874|nr:hypothetical protein [Streptomyces hygroscopicus]GLX52829.1 hypothetical protein Shyhy01_57790 [Streptomyces hygroscopicus subsp. hygroscopicus]
MDSLDNGSHTAEDLAPARTGGRGALIGALFGGIWYLIGVTGLRGEARQTTAAAGAVLIVAVVFAVMRLRKVHRVAPMRSGAPLPRRGRAFTRLLVVQAVLIGVGGGLISTRFHQPHAVFAWAALVVGAHFFPLARVLGAPVLKVLGTAMVAVAAAALIVAASLGGSQAVWQGLPGLGCAAALWGAVLVSAVRASRSTSDSAGRRMPARR